VICRYTLYLTDNLLSCRINDMNIVTPGIRLKNAGLSKNAIHKQSGQDQGQQRA